MHIPLEDSIWIDISCAIRTTVHDSISLIMETQINNLLRCDLIADVCSPVNHVIGFGAHINTTIHTQNIINSYDTCAH